MTVLTAYEMDAGRGDKYWEIYDNEFPYDPPVVVIDESEFGDYISQLLTGPYVEDIIINTYESWENM